MRSIDLNWLNIGCDDALTAGAEEAEVSATLRTLGITRFANSYLTQTGIVVEPATRVRVVVDGRVGAVTTGGTDRAALAEAGKLAVEIARHQPKSDFPGFARPAPLPQVPQTYDEATAAHTPGDRADALARVFERAARDRLLCAGSFVTGPREVAVVTSNGVAVHHRSTSALLTVIALDGDASGYASWYGPAVGACDPAALADEACETGARARDPVDLPPGAYDVVLSSYCVGEVLEWMAIASFDGSMVRDGTSFLAGNQGVPLCAPAITVVDDPTYVHPHAIPSPFDAEGSSRRRVALIDAGKGGEPLTDLHIAAKLGTRSTGHAIPVATPLAAGPWPDTLVVLPGQASDAELIARVERGLYVTRFHYVNGLLDTRRATMTGMTRDGAFLIENGKLGRAVHNLRFTESMLEAWGAERLGGVGNRLRAQPPSWTAWGTFLCPSLLIRGFHFTGRSR